MKRHIATYLLALMTIAAVAAPSAAMAQGKIAVADLRRLFDSYYKTKQADAALKDEAADIEKERKSMIDTYTKTEDEYKGLIDKANDQAISAEERARAKQSAEKKISDLRELEQSITRYTQAAAEKLREKENIKRKNIVSEICGVVEAKAKAAGFSMVIDSAAETVNKTPVFLYVSGENDITESVLSQLNAGAATATPKTDDTSLTNATVGVKPAAKPATDKKK
jgi:Skp family chaperone for outer membrane proteins